MLVRRDRHRVRSLQWAYLGVSDNTTGYDINVVVAAVIIIEDDQRQRGAIVL